MTADKQDYRKKIILKALEGKVLFDAQLECLHDGVGKLRVFNQDTGCYIQFPTALRKPRARFIADIYLMKRDGRKDFYRAVPESIKEVR